MSTIKYIKHSLWSMILVNHKQLNNLETVGGQVSKTICEYVKASLRNILDFGKRIREVINFIMFR